VRRLARAAFLLAIVLAGLRMPGEALAQPAAGPDLPPPDLLQLPFPIGDTWTFNGVHGPLKEAIDFSVGRPWPRWKANTSDMWVVAAAAGTVRRIASCGLEIDHADGWTTVYYHLENIVRDSGPVQANDRLANIANTPREAACDGGSATAPHLHFALKHNGEFVPIDGLTLSGWRIHAGRGRYDSACARMYLDRGDERLCPYTSPLTNRGVGAPPEPPSPGAQIAVDALPDRAPAERALLVQGWAIDHAGPSGTGVDHVHLYLDGPAGQGLFLAEAAYALPRPDVAAALGDSRFAAAGFSYAWDTAAIAPGPHTLFIYAHSTAAGWSYVTRAIEVRR